MYSSKGKRRSFKGLANVRVATLIQHKWLILGGIVLLLFIVV